MKKLRCLLIDDFMFLCLTVAMAALFCLHPGQAFGSDAGSGQRPVLARPQGNGELITRGVYGPFSSYYRPSLLLGEEICRLANSDSSTFQIICFPIMATSGMRLAETVEAEKIQAQLMAVNGPDGRPMPELILFIPLAAMDQKSFSQDIIKRLFLEESIFDSPCQLAYRADEQLPENENWKCSLFLNHFDKYTGREKITIELRARPENLRSTSEPQGSNMPSQFGDGLNVSAEKGPDLPSTRNSGPLGAANQDWLNFFKNLQGRSEFNINLALADPRNGNAPQQFNGGLNASAGNGLDGPLTATFKVEAALSLTGYGKWLDSLVEMHQDAESKQYFESINASEKIYGPFSRLACHVNRYVKADAAEQHQRLYQDVFFIDCNAQITSVEEIQTADKVLPKWLYRIFDYQTLEGSAAHSALPDNNDDLSVSLSLRGYKAPSGLNLMSISDSLFAGASIRFSPAQIEPNFFNSQLVRDTFNGNGQLNTPCELSFMVDGTLASREKLKCDLSYGILDGVFIDIDIDYGLTDCLQFSDKACAKAAFMKAVSFLKDVDKETKAIVVEIKLESGEAITAELNLDDLNLNDISLFLKRVESLEGRSKDGMYKSSNHLTLAADGRRF